MCRGGLSTSLQHDAMGSPLDVLAVGAHPDDVELAAGGTLCLLARRGYLVAALDLTEGELGSRGTVASRRIEAQAAAELLGLAAREQLGLPDGNITADSISRERLVRVLRRLRPHIVLTHPTDCRHPDHADAAKLVLKACFYSGLRKVDTGQEPWRPQHVVHFEEVLPFKPTLVVDVTDTWEQRTQAVQAYASQFYNPAYTTDEPETFVSNHGFFQWIEARARTHGFAIGATYGEAFQLGVPIGTNDLVQLLKREKAFR